MGRAMVVMFCKEYIGNGRASRDPRLYFPSLKTSVKQAVTTVTGKPLDAASVAQRANETQSSGRLLWRWSGLD